MSTDEVLTKLQQPAEASLGEGLALFTDLYQLTMLQAYFEERMTERAVFSLFVRRLPPNRNFLIACGLDTVLDYLETLRFTQQDLAYLDSLGVFSDRFLTWLSDFRFTGYLHSMREGTPVFANEPILEVDAPLPEAQLIETYVINQVQLQTMLASKAHRVVTAARGRSVIDFGARRMHGTDAALNAARAFWIAGVNATSNVLAGKRFGIPVAGTMAHSYIQAHGDEAAAFRAFANLYPNTVLLVDTYDTLTGRGEGHRSWRIELGEDFKIRAVRLDSGDLLDLSLRVRAALDQAGLSHIQIIASGSLDEYAIDALISSGAPLDGFGVGTAMGVSADAPYLDIVYKLTSYAGDGRVKLSANKPVLPGRKQVFRRTDGDRDTGDTVARADEDLPGRPLLSPVMRNGKGLTPPVDLAETRRYAAEQIARLPEALRNLPATDPPYPVKISPKLTAYHQEVVRKTAARSHEPRAGQVE